MCCKEVIRMDMTNKKNSRVKGMEGMNMRMSKENIKEITEYLAEASEHENEEYVSIFLDSVSQMILSETNYHKLKSNPKVFAKLLSNYITRLINSNKSKDELDLQMYLIALAMDSYAVEYSIWKRGL